MSEANKAAAAGVPQQEQGTSMLRRLVDILQFGLDRAEQAGPAEFQLVHVMYDAEPEVITFPDAQSLCEHLHELRLTLIEEADPSPRPHWLYVFRGTRCGLRTGLTWQLHDGTQSFDIGEHELPEERDSGLVNLGIPDTVVQQAQREDDAAVAAARAAESQREAAPDTSAQNVDEASD